MAKASKLGPKWVPMIEAARMVVRLDQALRRFQTNHEVIFALVEAARTGRVVAWGYRFATGELEKILPRDWQECHADWGRFVLYEFGRRLPRFTGIEFEPASIARVFASAGEDDAPALRRPRGAPDRERALRAIKKIFPGGVPDQACEPNVNLCRKVVVWLKQAKLPEVKDDTILRAAGRRK
jgi:hypothetical protein